MPSISDSSDCATPLTVRAILLFDIQSVSAAAAHADNR